MIREFKGYKERKVTLEILVHKEFKDHKVKLELTGYKVLKEKLVLKV